MTCRKGHAPRHPDFEAGNTAHLVHGARSPRVIAERAAQVHAELLEVADWLEAEHFAPAVQRYLDAAATEALLMDFIRQVTAEKGVGKVPVRTWEQLTAARRLAAKLGQDLGLDPIGHARLRAVAGHAELVGRSVAEARAEGAEIRAHREAQIAQEPPPAGHESDRDADDEETQP